LKSVTLQDIYIINPTKDIYKVDDIYFKKNS